jgi:hypothetical protein
LVHVFVTANMSKSHTLSQEEDDFRGYPRSSDTFTADEEEDFGVNIDPYTQSRKWNIAVVASVIVLVVAELVAMAYCIYRLVKLTEDTPAYIHPVAWSVLAGVIWSFSVPILALVTCIPQVRRKAYIVLGYLYVALLFTSMFIQIGCSSIPFFVYGYRAYGGAALVFLVGLYGVNLVVAGCRLIVATREDREVQKTQSEFVSSAF